MPPHQNVPLGKEGVLLHGATPNSAGETGIGGKQETQRKQKPIKNPSVLYFNGCFKSVTISWFNFSQTFIFWAILLLMDNYQPGSNVLCNDDKSYFSGYLKLTASFPWEFRSQSSWLWLPRKKRVPLAADEHHSFQQSGKLTCSISTIFH